jgi:hypothetical protein
LLLSKKVGTHKNKFVFSKIFGINRNVLVLQKKLEHIIKFWFYSKIFEINRNIPL